MQWRIGHRGASGTYPENTLLAFEKALKMGANAIELDVHCCKSGEAVVIHDSTLNRTTSGVGLVSKHTLAELKKLDAGDSEQIPTLEETLLAIAPRAMVLTEIKSNAAVAATAEAIGRAATTGIAYAQMPVISYRLSNLTAIKALNPDIVTGITPASQPTGLTQKAIMRAVAHGMWSINPNIAFLQKDFVQAAQAAGLKVISWTANTEADIKKAYALGVDGIMSDWPEKFFKE